MTGEKDRFKTHEKLWNLDDKQLTTPKHDEMVLKLFNRDYLLSFDVIKNQVKLLYSEDPRIYEYSLIYSLLCNDDSINLNDVLTGEDLYIASKIQKAWNSLVENNSSIYGENSIPVIIVNNEWHNYIK